MSETPSEAKKSCALCGTDVTSKPRVKDAKGNYFCRECAAKKQAELAKKVGKTTGPGAPAGSNQGDADIMARLVEDSIAKGTSSCPACRRPWREGAIICTNCGFNKQSGEIIKTQIKRPDSAKPKIIGSKKKK